ncbi:hypothetical protein HYY71_04310 [Candidatus Woesearchaeota archaeon]|nr:hypothetical protein [Candidatus Woesearchaeota archaeon]
MIGKKGQVLLYGVLAGLLAAMIIPAISQAGNKKSFNVIGEYSMLFLKQSKEAEKSLFYIDQSAKYALQQAVYELAQNGISVSDFELNEISINQPFERNRCGKFKETYAWYELKKDDKGNYFKSSCFEDSALTTNLKFIFEL